MYDLRPRQRRPLRDVHADGGRRRCPRTDRRPERPWPGGAVRNSADGETALRPTSAVHRADLEHAFELPFDYGRDYVFTRVIREALQAVERGESPAAVRERARELGEAILEPAVETVRAVDAGDPVGETHTVRGDPRPSTTCCRTTTTRGWNSTSSTTKPTVTSGWSHLQRSHSQRVTRRGTTAARTIDAYGSRPRQSAARVSLASSTVPCAGPRARCGAGR